MRLCQTHWDALRQGIEDRGMSHLIGKNAEVAMERIQRELAGTNDASDYDPLMAANFAIWSNGLEAGGLYLMGTKDDGSQYCPICESEAYGGHDAAWWINNACDEQLAKARAMKLVPLPS